MCGVEAAQGGEVEVVVMVVRQQDSVDRGQVFEADAGGGGAFGAGEADGAGAVGPNRIDQEVEPCDLYQQRGMADHRDGQVIDTRRGFRRGDGHMGGPCLAFAVPLPAEHVAQAFRCGPCGVEEARSVEMVGDGAGVVGVAGHAVAFGLFGIYGVGCLCVKPERLLRVAP